MDEEAISVEVPYSLPDLSLEYAPLPMATVEGATHLVRYVNPAFCLLMGKSAEQLVGIPLSELLPDRDNCVTLIERVFRSGKPLNHTEKDLSRNDPVFWSYTMWPLRADELLVGVMIQVTESTKTHRTTVEMNEALLLGSLRQHELTEAAENLNGQLRAEIAERKKTARELAEKARLLDLTHDAVVVRDLEGRITYWNHGAEEIYGWSYEEALGKFSDELFETEYPESFQRMVEELHRTSRWTGELVHTTRDGHRITVLARKTLDRDSAGEPASVLQTLTDITEKKVVETALLEAGELFRFMAESMPQKIFTANAAGEAEYLNLQWKEYTGLTLEEMRGAGWVKFIHPDELEENVIRWREAVEAKDYFEIEHRFRRRDGEYRWHLTRAHAMRDSAGKATRWIGSSTDIDDMMRAQVELMDAEAQLSDRALQLERLVTVRAGELATAHALLLQEVEERKRLEAEIAGAIEGERERLGQELHDGVVQELTGITMLLYSLAKGLEDCEPAMAEEARRLCCMLETAHGNARDLSKDFYPVELEQHGLIVALEGVAQRTEHQFGVSCEVEVDVAEEEEAKDPTSVQLFRIAQEAIQNVIKHASATKILIRIAKGKGEWLLSIKDDGIGLSGKVPTSESMGLRIMQYRARIIDGTLSVENADDGGVLVTCTAPYR